MSEACVLDMAANQLPIMPFGEDILTIPTDPKGDLGKLACLQGLGTGPNDDSELDGIDHKFTPSDVLDLN